MIQIKSTILAYELLSIKLRSIQMLSLRNFENNPIENGG